jgi:hypothetical protein
MVNICSVAISKITTIVNSGSIVGQEKTTIAIKDLVDLMQISTRYQ